MIRVIGMLLLISIAVELAIIGTVRQSQKQVERVDKTYQASASAIPAHQVHVPILLYHYISTNRNPLDTLRSGLSTPAEIFEKQLQFLIQYGYTTVSFDDLLAALTIGTPLPNKPVILTFDDGYLDFYINAYPLLSKYKMKATQFIPAGLIGKPEYMTWDQILELSQSQYITIGAHSVNHFLLPKLSYDAMYQEVIESKRTLENKIQRPVYWFAYPYGGYTDAVIQAVQASGYKGAISTDKGSLHTVRTLFTLHRVRPGTKIFNDFLIILQ